MPHDLLLRFNQRVIVHGLRDCLSPETLDVQQICKASCLDNNTKTQTRHFQLSEPSESKVVTESSLLAPVKNQVVRKRGGTPLKRGLEQVCAGSRLKQTWKYTFP